MSNPPKQIRVSASRLKTLWDCSLKFYYQEVLHLPDATHWKTKTGSIVHLVFECIMNQRRPKRAALFRSLMTHYNLSLMADYPGLVRFIEWQIRREGIVGMVSAAEILLLVEVAWLGIRPHFTTSVSGELTYTPPPRFINEHRFQITLSSGAVISGFIDLLLVWPDRAVVIDLKSQGTKFPQAELPNNVQAGLYALVCHREEGFTPTVEFIMLRHPPGPRSPMKHIQRVEPPSAAALAGLEAYVDSMYVMVNQFTFEDALRSPHEDSGFCTRVCTHYAPHPYWTVHPASDPKGEITQALSSHLTLDSAQKAVQDTGESIVERQFNGCHARWRG